MTTVSTSTVVQPAPNQVVQEPTKKEFHVTEGSLRTITGGRPIVVSYGYSTTGWNETGEAMKRILGEDNVWNYTLAQTVIPEIDPSTGKPKLDKHDQAITVPSTHISSIGEELAKIRIPEAGSSGGLPEETRGLIKARRLCKAGLINTVFHNYRMLKHRKDDFIPITFPTSLSTVWGTQKRVEKDSRTTCSEINLLRKLCTDTDFPEDFRQTARQTVKFIDVQDETIIDETSVERPDETTRITTYSFKEIAAPWEVDGYAVERARVKQAWLAKNPSFQRPEGSKGVDAPRAFGWKKELQTFMDPSMCLLPDPDEIELVVPEETTTVVNTPVEETTEFPTMTPTTQTSEEPTSRLPVTKAETVIVSIN